MEQAPGLELLSAFINHAGCLRNVARLRRLDQEGLPLLPANFVHCMPLDANSGGRETQNHFGWIVISLKNLRVIIDLLEAYSSNW